MTITQILRYFSSPSSEFSLQKGTPEELKNIITSKNGIHLVATDLAELDEEDIRDSSTIFIDIDGGRYFIEEATEGDNVDSVTKKGLYLVEDIIVCR